MLSTLLQTLFDLSLLEPVPLCQLQHIDHHIPKRETLDHPPRRGNTGYRSLLGLLPAIYFWEAFLSFFVKFCFCGEALAVFQSVL